MARELGAFAVDRVVPLFDDLYYDFLTEAFSRSRLRIWGELFIVNVLVAADPDRKVRRLLQLLGARRATGVRVRLILGRSLTPDIQLCNVVSLGYARRCGLPTRAHGNGRRSAARGGQPKAISEESSAAAGISTESKSTTFPRRANRTTHNKFVVVDDDLVVLGSHNWTHSAFTSNVEDSLAVYSQVLNHELQLQFRTAWNK